MEITTHSLRRLYRSLRWGTRDPDLGPDLAANRDLRYVSGYHHFMQIIDPIGQFVAPMFSATEFPIQGGLPPASSSRLNHPCGMSWPEFSGFTPAVTTPTFPSPAAPPWPVAKSTQWNRPGSFLNDLFTSAAAVKGQSDLFCSPLAAIRRRVSSAPGFLH
jgi:hypothetical protein